MSWVGIRGTRAGAEVGCVRGIGALTGSGTRSIAAVEDEDRAIRRLSVEAAQDREHGPGPQARMQPGRQRDREPPARGVHELLEEQRAAVQMAVHRDRSLRAGETGEQPSRVLRARDALLEVLYDPWMIGAVAVAVGLVEARVAFARRRVGREGDDHPPSRT